MIKISPAKSYIKSHDYSFLICPNCNKGRLCGKLKGQKVVAVIAKTSVNHIVLKCPKCSEVHFIEAI